MADNKKTTVSAKANTLENAKSKQQKDNAKELEAKKKEADKKALEAREEAERQKKEAEERRKAEEEQKRLEAEQKAAAEQQAREEEEQRNKELLAAAGKIAAAGSAAAFAAAKTTKGRFKFLKGLLLGLVIGLLVGSIGVYLKMRDPIHIPAVTGTVASVEDHDLTIDNDNFLGYTAADFENAVLGGASEHQELIVMEQPLQIETTITQAGLGKLAIFSKVKSINFSTASLTSYNSICFFF